MEFSGGNNRPVALNLFTSTANESINCCKAACYIIDTPTVKQHNHQVSSSLT